MKLDAARPRGPSLRALLRAALRELFAVVHRRDKLTAAGFQKALEAARQQVVKDATTRVPKGNHAQNLAKRFREHGEAYFRFITTLGIEPTWPEQAIRFVVIDRRITMGTRSETGRRWCERIWTTIATCAQQGRSVFKFLLDSVHALFQWRFRHRSCRQVPNATPLRTLFSPFRPLPCGRSS